MQSCEVRSVHLQDLRFGVCPYGNILALIFQAQSRASPFISYLVHLLVVCLP